jgi:hypothetical protein
VSLCFFLVFFSLWITPLGCSSSLPLPPRMDDGIKLPSTLIFDLFSLSLHRFLNCFRYHTTCSHTSFLPPVPSSLILSLAPSVNLSQSLSLARVQRSSRTDNIPHSQSQNTSINPTIPVFFEFCDHHSSSAIPSHHPYPLYHRHRAYTYSLSSSNIVVIGNVICIPHPPTHPWPTLNVCGSSSVSCLYSRLSYLPIPCVLHSVIMNTTWRFSRATFTYTYHT